MNAWTRGVVGRKRRREILDRITFELGRGARFMMMIEEKRGTTSGYAETNFRPRLVICVCLLDEEILPTV